MSTLNTAPPLHQGQHTNDTATYNDNEEQRIGQVHSNDGTATHQGYHASSTNGKNQNGYGGGAPMTQTITPGGHTINDELFAMGTAPRKLANPLPMGVMAFGTTTFLLSLYNAGVRNLTTPNAIVTFALFYGGLTQYIAGIMEAFTGNTFGATVFTAFGCFWWGFAMYLIPFFGEMGMYDGQPGVYSATGVAASEAESAIGLFLFIWMGITIVLFLGAARSSITLLLLLFLLAITFLCLGVFYYTGVAAWERAGGGLGIATAAVAFWLAAGSFLTRYTSFFTLPLGDVSVKD